MQFSAVYLKGEHETLTAMAGRWDTLTPLERERLYRAFRKLAKQLRGWMHQSHQMMTLYCSAKHQAQKLKERWAAEKGSETDDQPEPPPPPEENRPDDGAAGAGACVGG